MKIMPEILSWLFYFPHLWEGNSQPFLKLNLIWSAVEVRQCWKAPCPLGSSARLCLSQRVLSHLFPCCWAEMLRACAWEMHFHNEGGWHGMGAFASQLRKRELGSIEMALSFLPAAGRPCSCFSSGEQSHRRRNSGFADCSLSNWYEST